MSDITEIYICKDGQSLNEGKLEISHSVETRDDAESDAIQRCRFDPSVAKIGYYAMSDDGSFRNFYTYRNPNPAAQRRKSAVLGTPPPDRAKRRKAARPPPSLWRRIVGFFQET